MSSLRSSPSTTTVEAACPGPEQLLANDEYEQWTALGQKLLKGPEGSSNTSLHKDLYEAFCRSSTAILDEGSYHHLRNWGEQGLEIASRSLPAAVSFFLSTPAFLKVDSVYRLRSWASGISQVLALGDAGEPAAAAFFPSSAVLLQHMTFRELREWTATGLILARTSSVLARDYFSLVPKGLDQLYSTEWLRICKIGAAMARSHPEKVVSLFEHSPLLILEISPAVRSLVLDAAMGHTAAEPETVEPFLREIVTVLRGCLYPTQELVLDCRSRIDAVSPAAAQEFVASVRKLLDDMSEVFLPHWIDKGLSILSIDTAAGLHYFALESSAAGNERLRWQNAVRFDDCRRELSIFAHAVAGKKQTLYDTGEKMNADANDTADYPSGDGETIFLPPFIADAESRYGNSRRYRTAAAHQAGHVAYGTYSRQLGTIIARLKNLPQPYLALDIFTILEDGRIDRSLGLEFPGLRRDIADSIGEEMRRRPQTADLPTQKVFIEALLQWTVGHLCCRRVTDGLTQFTDPINGLLSAGYEKAQTAWDSYILARRVYDHISSWDGQHAYTPMIPLSFRGHLDLDLRGGIGSPEVFPGAVTDADGTEKGLYPVPAEELKAILQKAGVPEDLRLINDEDFDGQGLFVSDLKGIKGKGLRNISADMNPDAAGLPAVSIRQTAAQSAGPYYYDEWDYLANTYRRNWCRLLEWHMDPAESNRVDDISEIHRDLILKVRKQFQRIRPTQLEVVRRVDWGDEIDFPALVEGIVDRKSGTAPSDKVFTRKEKKVRQTATLFLLDMSASTSEQIPVDTGQQSLKKTIIDIEVESLVVLMEALEALSDQYGIYGFSGYGREQVDFYRIKDFADTYSSELKQRIGAIAPKQGTRMGPVIRHAAAKLRKIEADQRIMLLLSDGYPQDHDYGEDRRSNDYGLHDTMMALLEAKKEGIQPFCITVDQSGNDYLRKMCDPATYLVIKDIRSLPEMLPKIVESLMV